MHSQIETTRTNIGQKYLSSYHVEGLRIYLAFCVNFHIFQVFHYFRKILAMTNIVRSGIKSKKGEKDLQILPSFCTRLYCCRHVSEKREAPRPSHHGSQSDLAFP